MCVERKYDILSYFVHLPLADPVSSEPPTNPTNGNVALISTVRPTACRLTILERMPPKLRSFGTYTRPQRITLL